MIRSFTFATAVVCAALCVCRVAVADTVIVGNSSSNNVYPFGDASYVGEYQQVYNASAFQTNGPVAITAIAFFLNPPYSPGTGIYGSYVLDLSTTTASASNLSTAYANNIGADNKLFTSGTVTNILAFTGSPFVYDSSKGNLLLDVGVTTADPTETILEAGCSTDTNRIYGNAQTGAENCASFGLRTEFTFAPASTSVTPEPSSLLLLSSGVAALLTAGRRRLPRAGRLYNR